MSQSDYIFLKRISQELSNIEKNLDPVLTSRQYTDYKLYTLAYNIPNTKTIYSQNPPDDMQLIFDMERPKYMDCSGFTLCEDTDKRPNRVLDGPQHDLFNPATYNKYQNTDLFQLSTPAYMNHLKSVNYINTNLCDNCGNYLCNNNTPIVKKSIFSEVFLPTTTPNYPEKMQSKVIYPNAIRKNASYAGYNQRKVAQNYARLLQGPSPIVPLTLISPVNKGLIQSNLFV